MTPSAKLICKSVLLTSLFKCKLKLVSYERFCTWTRFETEAEDNSEMAYFIAFHLSKTVDYNAFIF